ncbi:hypothetical protein KCU77_g14643, partial [Aureobasidium melanogenum]
MKLNENIFSQSTQGPLSPLRMHAVHIEDRPIPETVDIFLTPSPSPTPDATPFSQSSLNELEPLHETPAVNASREQASETQVQQTPPVIPPKTPLRGAKKTNWLSRLLSKSVGKLGCFHGDHRKKTRSKKAPKQYKHREASRAGPTSYRGSSVGGGSSNPPVITIPFLGGIADYGGDSVDGGGNAADCGGNSADCGGNLPSSDRHLYSLQNMPPTLPRTGSIAESSSRLSQKGNVTLHTAVLTTQDTMPQQITKPAQVQTTDYGEPSTASCFSLRRHNFTKRFKKLLRSNRPKPKGVLSPGHSIQLSDEELDQPVRMSGSEHRGRKTTAKLPLGANRPPTLYDDGQGSWVGEFGYIYRSGMDMTRSRPSLGVCGEAGPASRPFLEAKDGYQRVDSRTVAGFQDAANGISEQDSRDARSLGEAGVEGDIPQDQQLSGDGSTHDNAEDQHIPDETTEAESPEERCGSCSENEDQCDDTGCSCQDDGRCCSGVGDD